MIKGKILIVGLIGLLLAVGIILFSCDTKNENCVGDGDCYTKKVGGGGIGAGSTMIEYEKNSHKDCEKKCTINQAFNSSSSYNSFSCDC